MATNLISTPQYSPIQNAAFSLLTIGCLLGFGINEELKEDVNRLQEANFSDPWWTVAYTLVLPVACVLLLALDGGGGFSFKLFMLYMIALAVVQVFFMMGFRLFKPIFTPQYPKGSHLF